MEHLWQIRGEGQNSAMVFVEVWMLPALFPRMVNCPYIPLVFQGCPCAEPRLRMGSAQLHNWLALLPYVLMLLLVAVPFPCGIR